MMAPPGYPNTRSTPSARRQSRTICAPLRIDDLGLISGLGFGLSLLGGFARQPRHHAAQFGADFLDGVLLFGFTQRGKVLAAVLVLGDPLAGEGAVLNVRKDLLHLGAG